MLRSDKINIAGIMLLLAGELIIIFGFYFFRNIFVVPGVIYLDFIVISCVYFLIFSNMLSFFIPVSEFESKVGGLGINWFFMGGYAVLSLLGVIIGVSATLSLKLQLLYQLAFVFLLAVGYFSSAKSVEFSQSVAEEQQEARNPVINIQNLINQVHIAFTRKKLNWDFETNLLNEIIEKCRNVSPSNSITAKDLEAEIISELEMLMSQFVGVEPDRDTVKNILMNCDNLLKHRKKLYTN